MRFVLVGPTYPFRGGIAHHTTRLYDALRSKHSIEFITFRRQYPRWLFPGKTDLEPDPPFRLPIAIPMLDSLNPLTWFATASHVRSLHPDALIIPWWEAYWGPSFATIAGLIKRAGARIIFVCHNFEPHEPRICARILTRIALRQGHGFVVQSAGDEARIAELVPRAIVKYVPHPIYTSSHRTVQTHLTRQDDTAHLFFFGFVRPYKGLRVLIEALPHVLENKPVHLTVAGEFWENRREYERRIRALGIERAVTLIDRYVPDEELDELFARTDLVVLPYVSVTTSAAVGRALGNAVPVVVSDVGDLGNIVRENLIGGVAEPSNPVSLARTIIECLEPSKLECYRKNAQAMRESAAQSWERLVTAIEELAAA